MPDYNQTIKGRVNLETGQPEDADGNVQDTGFDEEALAENLKMFAPKKPTLVGNVADMQVLGAKAAAGKEKDVTLPPNPTPEIAMTDPQREPGDETKVVPPVSDVEYELVEKKADK